MVFIENHLLRSPNTERKIGYVIEIQIYRQKGPASKEFRHRGTPQPTVPGEGPPPPWGRVQGAKVLKGQLWKFLNI